MTKIQIKCLETQNTQTQMDLLKGKSDQAKEKNSKLEDTALRKVPRMQRRDQAGPMALGPDSHVAN